jgi:DNA repair exonuclease SbcCD ATPase subunit
MNLFVAISDVHISLKNLDVSIATLTQALNKSRDLKVPLFIAGDLNDGKAIMRSEWVKALIDLFFEYSDVHVHILIGNHDLDNKNSESNSLYFLKTLSNVTLYDRPQMMKNTDESDWGIIPYMSSTLEFEKALSEMEENNVKNLIIHQGILGAYMGDYVVDESSIPPERFEKFDIVLSGHYHRSQKVGKNIYYFGSPFTVNFGEANESKFIWKVEKLSGNIILSPEMTNVRRHFQLVFNNEYLSNAGKLDSYPAGSLLKVVVQGTKEFVRGYDLDYFHKAFPGMGSISIVPEIEKQSENRISADIIHSPLKVIEAYLQSCVTDHNKEELKDFLLRACQDIFQKHTNSSSKSFRIVDVEVENFLSFKKMDFKYKPMGLTLLEGYDEDLGVNTGAGKSSFLDAPVYGIFGETSKNLKSDEVINRLTGKNLKIVTTLEGEDGLYKIFRYRKDSEKDNDLYMLLPNGQELRGKDNRETQKLIEQILGCNFDVFLKSTYFTQFGSIDRFLSASDTEKKKLISEITDLSIYDEMLDVVKKNIATDESALSIIKIKKDQLQSNIELLNTQQEDLKRRSARWKDDIDVLIRSAEFESSEFEKTKLEELDVLEKKHSGWLQFNQDRIVQLESLSSKWEESILLVKKDNEAKIHINNGHIAEEEFKIDELKQIPIVDITGEKQKIQAKLDIVEQLEKKMIQLESQAYSKKQEVQKLRSKVESEEEKLLQGQDSECSYCHQSISFEHINKHIDLYKKELEPILVEINDLNSQVEKISVSIKIKTDLKKQLLDLDETYKKQYEIKYKIELHQRAIKNYQDQNTTLEHENLKQHINPHLAQLNSIKNESSPYLLQIELTKNKKNFHLSIIEGYKAQTNPHIDGIKKLEGQIQSLHEELADFSIKGETYASSLKFGLWWKQAIHVYIKSYLMDSCLENLNTIADEYLKTLFDGVLSFNISATTEKGSDVKEKINISIINNGDECSYQSLSGGERCRICLAVNLALAEVIAKSSGKSFNMVFLDEIFNGLDEVGKSQSMRLLKDLERKYESIFVIDHAEGFKNLFTNSIVIKKKDKVSSIV